MNKIKSFWDLYYRAIVLSSLSTFTLISVTIFTNFYVVPFHLLGISLPGLQHSPEILCIWHLAIVLVTSVPRKGMSAPVVSQVFKLLPWIIFSSSNLATLTIILWLLSTHATTIKLKIKYKILLLLFSTCLFTFCPSQNRDHLFWWSFHFLSSLDFKVHHFSNLLQNLILSS